MAKFDMKKVRTYAILGALAGVATPYLLKLISTVLSYIPGVSVQLQSVTVTGNVGQAVGTGMGAYAKQLLGLVPLSIGVPELFFTAIGGALFMVLGYGILETIGQFKGSKLRKLTSIMVIAGIVSGWILSMSVSIPAIIAIVEMVVNALILSWILIAVDKNILKGRFIPA